MGGDEIEQLHTKYQAIHYELRFVGIYLQKNVNRTNIK